jgi:hypothetical protein
MFRAHLEFRLARLRLEVSNARDVAQENADASNDLRRVVWLFEWSNIAAVKITSIWDGFHEYLLAGRRGLKESRSFWQCDRAYSTLRGDDAASTPDHQLLPSIDQCFSESLWSKRHEEAVLKGVLSRIMARTFAATMEWMLKSKLSP